MGGCPEGIGIFQSEGVSVPEGVFLCDEPGVIVDIVAGGLLGEDAEGASCL